MAFLFTIKINNIFLLIKFGSYKQLTIFVPTKNKIDMKTFRKLIKESQDQIDSVNSLLETAEQNQKEVINNFIKYLILNERYDSNWSDVEAGFNQVEVTLGIEDFTVHISIEAHWSEGIQNDECHNPNECEFILDYIDFDMILDSEGEEVELTNEVEQLLTNTFKK